jgi:hypothetical protein
MTDKRAGPLEVRPNTLLDERAPNTFRNEAAPGTVGRQDRNSGGGKTASRRHMARPHLRLWAYVALTVLAVIVALYLLNGAP